MEILGCNLFFSCDYNFNNKKNYTFALLRNFFKLIKCESNYYWFFQRQNELLRNVDVKTIINSKHLCLDALKDCSKTHCLLDYLILINEGINFKESDLQDRDVDLYVDNFFREISKI